MIIVFSNTNLTLLSTGCGSLNEPSNCFFFFRVLNLTYHEMSSILIFSQQCHSPNRIISHSQSDKGQSIDRYSNRKASSKNSTAAFLWHCAKLLDRQAGGLIIPGLRCLLLGKSINHGLVSHPACRGYRSNFRSCLMLGNWSLVETITQSPTILPVGRV